MIDFLKNKVLLKRLLFSWNTLALLLLVLLVAKSIVDPTIPWDSWGYHFPFSAQLMGMNKSNHFFIIDPVLKPRFDGFPLLAEFIQGLLWKFTGNIKLTALISSVSFVAFIVLVSKKIPASFAKLTFGLLAIPLIAIHAASTYIDLFFSIAISLQFVGLIFMEKVLRGDEDDKSRKINGWLIVCVLAAIVAGNTKLWAPAIVLANTFIFLIYVVVKRDKYRSSKNLCRRIAFFLLLGALLSCGTFGKNFIEHKNPFYPINYSIPSLGVTFAGPESEYKDYPGYADNLGITARVVYFATSVTEVDWLIRGVMPKFNIDSSAGDQPKRFHSARTGGFFSLLVLSCATFLVVIYRKLKKSDKNKDIIFSLYSFAGLTLFTSLMPQSHELRYFLYWSIILVFIVVYAASFLPQNSRLPAVITKIFFTLFLLVSVMLLVNGKSFLDIFSYFGRAYGSNVTPFLMPDFQQVIAAAKKSGGVCLGPEFNPHQFKYTAIFNGGDYTIEQGFYSCHRFKPLVLPKK